jgi:23S rRNA (uracil1939-C5)-methyltransferase
MKRGDELEVRIENFAFEGKSISRQNGFVVFVRGAVPGDVARIRVEKVKRNFAEAIATNVLQPSPIRTTAPCKYFGACGGCAWQHVQYEAQLQLKRQNVIDAFERIGGMRGVKVEPTLPCKELYYYRNKSEFSFAMDRWILDQAESLDAAGAKRIALGFHGVGQYDKVLDIDACMLQSEMSNQILRAVKEYAHTRQLDVYDPDSQTGSLRYLVIREGKNTGEWMVNLVTFLDHPELASGLCSSLRELFPSLTTFVNTINSRRAQVATGDVERIYYGDGTITERLGRFRFRISAHSFFQTNTRQAENLFEVVEHLGDFRKTDVVYDLYSGAGSLSIYISDSVRTVVGVELVESAVDDARHNASLNHVTNCTFLQGDLRERLTKDTAWIDEHGVPDVVLVDPPRSGMHPKVVQRVAQLRPPRMLYVSCNPATQARDIRSLVGAGYELKILQPVDLFPQTFHVETVAKLTLSP